MRRENVASNRSGFLKPPLLVVTMIVLCGCMATQPPSHASSSMKAEIKSKMSELVLLSRTEKLAQLERLSDLTWPIASKNLAICGNHRKYAIGLTLLTPDDFKGDLEVTQLYRKSLDFEGKPLVQIVIKDSPADRAGLQKGDLITKIGTNVFDPNSSDQFTKTARRHVAQLVRKGRAFDIGFIRNGEVNETRITPQRVCKYQLEIDNSTSINAYTDGHNIAFTRGLLMFASDDRFLQAVFAHELAHGIHQHVVKTLPRSAMGFVLDLATLSQGIWTNGFFSKLSGQFMNKEVEREADYVAYYLLANAEIELDGVFDDWEKLAVHLKGGDHRSSTHPSYAERLVMQDHIVREIQQKIESNQPLLPNTQ